MMLPRNTSIYLATTPVDLRWSFDILSGLAKERIREDPRSGGLFLFLNKPRNRIKILFYDRSGFCLLYKRLDRGTFPLPIVIEPGAERVEMSIEQLESLLLGLTPQRANVKRKPRSTETPPTVH